MGTKFFIMGLCPSQKNTSSRQKARSKKKVHVRGTIACKPLCFAKNCSKYFLEDTLGYFMNIIFLSHTSYLLSKMTVLWHPRCKIFTSGHFLENWPVRFIYKKYILSENMFLKTYKKIRRFVHPVFPKKTKMCALFSGSSLFLTQVL